MLPEVTLAKLTAPTKAENNSTSNYNSSILLAIERQILIN